MKCNGEGVMRGFGQCEMDNCTKGGVVGKMIYDVKSNGAIGHSMRGDGEGKQF